MAPTACDPKQTWPKSLPARWSLADAPPSIGHPGRSDLAQVGKSRRILRHIAGRGDHLCAAFLQAARYTLPDSAIAARHDTDLAGESESLHITPSLFNQSAARALEAHLQAGSFVTDLLH